MEHADIASRPATETRAAFSCDPKALAGAVKFLASKVIERRNTFPILSCVMIEAAPDGTLTLTGNNLDELARVRLVADVESPGAFCTDAGALSDAIAKLAKAKDCHTVTIAEADGRAVVKGEGTRTAMKMPTLPVDDFPVMAAPTGEEEGGAPLSRFAVPAGRFLADLAALAPCISTEEARYYLNGVSLQRREMAGRERFVMAATDGYQIGAISRDVPAGADSLADCILPRNAVALIAHAAKLAGPIEAIEISKGERFGFTVGNVEIISKEIAGTFPDWERPFTENLAPTVGIEGEDGAALFPDLLPGVPIAKLEKLAKAAGASIDWSEGAQGKIGAVAGDPDMIFGVMALATGSEPVKGYRYSSDADAACAHAYLKALAESLHGKLKYGWSARLIVEGGAYRGLTVGESVYVPGRYEERPNWETLHVEQVYIEPSQQWADGSYSMLMPESRAAVRQDYCVTVDGDQEYPVAVNSTATKIHLSAEQVRALIGESCFVTFAVLIGGKTHHVLKWLWDDGASRFLTVQANGRCFKDGSGLYLDRATIEAALAGEIVEAPAMPEIASQTGAGEAMQESVALGGGEAVEALCGLPTANLDYMGEITPEREWICNPDYNGEADAEPEAETPDPIAELTARLEALEVRLATLPVVSVEIGIPITEAAPIRAARTPAHERAIRRAWQERKERRRLRQKWAETKESFRFVLARGEVRQEKRRRSTQLARQRGREMVAMAKALHDAAATIEALNRSPLYMDATGREGIDQVGKAAHHARTALDRLERSEALLSEERARVARMQSAIDGLAQEFETATVRAIRAERALAAVTARKDGWPPAVRSVNVKFAA